MAASLAQRCRFSWHRQEELLRDIYGQVLGRELHWRDPDDPAESST
jgi:hypothetical protein